MTTPLVSNPLRDTVVEREMERLYQLATELRALEKKTMDDICAINRTNATYQEEINDRQNTMMANLDVRDKLEDELDAARQRFHEEVKIVGERLLAYVP